MAIVNAGAALEEVSFSVALQAEDKPSYAIKVGAKRVGTDSSPAASTPASVEAPAGVAGIAANSVSWFEVTFERLSDFQLDWWLSPHPPRHRGADRRDREMLRGQSRSAVASYGGSAAVPVERARVVPRFVLALILGRRATKLDSSRKKIGSPKWSSTAGYQHHGRRCLSGNYLGARFFRTRRRAAIGQVDASTS